MRTGMATVCLSGTLSEKLQAIAAAGFDEAEIFEPDLLVARQSPEEVRATAERLGLRLSLYQPLRDVEGVEEDLFARNLRRAGRKFHLARRLGIDTVLLCSNVATATTGEDDVLADQLRRVGDVADRHGVRVAYEALAWGTFVDDYRRAWALVAAADHDAVGVCLDSFHVLSRRHDPRAIEDIPGEKVFHLQLADAPLLSMDVLSWSRHHRLFPGEGGFDLSGFLVHVLRSGYRGSLSLEVFNDVFRQTDPYRTAEHAFRSLLDLEDRTAHLLREGGGPPGDLRRATPVPPPTGFDFVEVKAEDTDPVENLLRQLGLRFAGQHRTKPVRLLDSGTVRLVLDEQRARDRVPHVSAVGLLVADAPAAVQRAEQFTAPAVPRRTGARERVLRAVAAPDGTEVFFDDTPPGGEGWTAEFLEGAGAADGLLTGVDHVNLVQSWEAFDEAVLFYRSVLGLQAVPSVEVASPVGLVRSQVVRSADGRVRLALNVAPAADARRPVQHVAFRSSDVLEVARRSSRRGAAVLPVPPNYYEDLAARFELPDELLVQLQELGVLYDRDGAGEFLHFYTRTVGEVFFEVVERRGGYEGYGAPNAPVRLAAQFELRASGRAGG